MAFSPGYVKETLVSSIQDMMKTYPKLFGYDPSTSRNRKLPIETVVRLLISMDGGSLAKELRQAGINATPSAFVQRRRAIDPQGMREIFRDFNRFSPDTVYGDYRIYAIDGTTVNMARNPNFPTFIAKLIEEIRKYTEPVREGRQDFRNMKPKSFAGFIYRVAA